MEKCGNKQAKGSRCLVRLAHSYGAHDVDDRRSISSISLGMVEYCDSCTSPRNSLGDK